jgi:hypothetical protein
MNGTKTLVDMGEFDGWGAIQGKPLRVWRTLRGFACRKAPQREGLKKRLTLRCREAASKGEASSLSAYSTGHLLSAM